ncbi:MAG: acetyl-CoA carboxylase, carboxyltransferase subunit beta [Rhodospirillales bacterium]|jgi:acetyl-CoA carboxylase carboxyl transferase subunit beta|nr:acetyl-CoA carboxylase, carboxyltransferase subunit beta [Rhodospirillales bacterium]
MSWLTNVVRPKLREWVGAGSRAVPDNLWEKCPECEQMIFHRELESRLRVCPHCDHHLRLPVETRLAMLFDDAVFETIESPKTPSDPLKFRDLRKYPERLKEAQTRTGRSEAAVIALGAMGGLPVVTVALNFEFMGGSMGVAVGEAILQGARRAVGKGASFIIVSSSGGARMQEGILSLMQMARTTIAVQLVREAGLPYFALLTDPTTGGVSASFAMLGDITIAEPGAIIGFAGARVIEQTIRESLPAGFQKAEYLLDHGMVDLIVHRSELRETIVRLNTLLRRPRPEEALPAEVLELGEAQAAGEDKPQAARSDPQPADGSVAR